MHSVDKEAEGAGSGLQLEKNSGALEAAAERGNRGLRALHAQDMSVLVRTAAWGAAVMRGRESMGRLGACMNAKGGRAGAAAQVAGTGGMY